MMPFRIALVLRKRKKILMLLVFVFLFSVVVNRFRPVGSPNDVGYAFACHYSDQLSGATLNLMSLQCWASTLPGKVVVVEPFVKDAILGVSLVSKTRSDKKFDKHDLPYDNNTIKLSDLYDEAQWSDYTSRRRFTPLVGWGQFLHKPRMPIIAVDGHPHDTEEQKEFPSIVREFAQKHNFTVAREVYYSRIKTYTADELKKLIYGSLHPAQYVVIFSTFGGIRTAGDKFRLKISGPIGGNCSRRIVIFKDSLRIMQESSSYIEKYLPENQYIGVMVRMEYFYLDAGLESMSREKQLSRVQTYIQAIVNQVNTLRNSTGTSSVFVTTDSGKYGYEEIKSIFHEGVLENAIQMLYKQLYNDSVTVDMFSNLVDKIASIHSRGYVASLERVIAAKGTCLVLAGGGSFQCLAFDKYHTKSYHQGKSPGCGVSIV